MVGKIHHGDRHIQGAITKAQIPSQRYFICNNQHYSVWNSFSLNEPNPGQLGVVKTELALANPTNTIREVRHRRHFIASPFEICLTFPRLVWGTLFFSFCLSSQGGWFRSSHLFPVSCSSCLGRGPLSAWCPSPWQHPQSSCPFPGMLRSKREPTPDPTSLLSGETKVINFLSDFRHRAIKFVLHCLASTSR